MESVVGENSYVNIDDADKYIRQHYGTYDPLRVIWSVLRADEKEVLLQNAMTELEALPVVGAKFMTGQKLQFPRRVLHASVGFSAYYGASFYGQAYTGEIPQAVKAAQVEVALALIAAECEAQSNKQFLTMQSLGAVNIKFTKREFSDASIGGITPIGTVKKRLSSDKAEALMRPYLGQLRG